MFYEIENDIMRYARNLSSYGIVFDLNSTGFPSYLK